MAATSPGLIGTLRGVVNCYQFISPSSPEQYVATARSIEDVIARVDPALMLIDPLFEQAIDAARRSGKDYVKISPNTILEVAADKQGLGLFNWPA